MQSGPLSIYLIPKFCNFWAQLYLTAKWQTPVSILPASKAGYSSKSTNTMEGSCLDVTFGPSGDEWSYRPSTKTYDLTRGSSQPSFAFNTTRGPPDIIVKVAPERTALVVIDMQNYFLHPSCNNHPSGIAAVGCTLDVIRKCREIGIKVQFSTSDIFQFCSKNGKFGEVSFQSF